MLIAVLAMVVLAAAVFGFILLRTAIAQGTLKPSPEAILVGGLVNFFDTLGIGSFAPTLTWLTFRAQLPPRLIPCTMIVACTLPTMLQAVIFLVLLGVHVDPVLLAAYAVALLAGGVIGARLVTRVPIWIVQAVVGVALLVAATFYGLSNLHLMPAGGVATGLPIPLMVVAVAASFTMGVLLNFGVGHYAPSLLMLSLLGMDPRLAFPIMATGGALTAAVISSRHVRVGVADIRIAIAFALGGIPGVLIAALVVKDMPVAMLRWLVIVVVVYAAAVMLRDAVKALRHTPSEIDPIALAKAEGLTD